MPRFHPKIAARILLLGAAVICAVGMLGPFGGIESDLVPEDKAAHFIAFYGLTLLMFSAFPNRRRLDLVMLAAFGGLVLEIGQRLTGRDAEIGDVAADTLGAMAVLAPVWLEHLRFPRVERRTSALRRLEAPEPEPVREAA